MTRNPGSDEVSLAWKDRLQVLAIVLGVTVPAFALVLNLKFQADDHARDIARLQETLDNVDRRLLVRETNAYTQADADRTRADIDRRLTTMQDLLNDTIRVQHDLQLSEVRTKASVSALIERLDLILDREESGGGQ